MNDDKGDRTDPFREVTGAALPSNLEYIRQLGRGSMAQVFLARNRTLRRLVAIKVLYKELADDPLGRKRFIREAQAAARIDHPGVTSVYAVGTLENDIPYIEMQYVEGSNLAEVLRGHGRFDVAAARDLLARLAGALAAAHDGRIIHRDVKPANVLIENATGDAFLTDFGVAGILETGSEMVTKLTRESDRLGDERYMSPEQLRGEPVTEQADIYSLGIIGYEILTLYGPFGTQEITDMSGAHIRRAPVNLHELHPEIPKDLSDILQRCLSKNPAHRPRAGDLAVQIPGGSGDELDEAAPPSDALGSFLAELNKRKVYRAAVTYAAVIFVILQVADLVVAPLNIPDWVYRIVVVISLAGFPVILALAWVFDLRKGQLLRTEDDTGAFWKGTSAVQRLLLQVLGLGLSIAIAAGIAWWLLSPEK